MCGEQPIRQVRREPARHQGRSAGGEPIENRRNPCGRGRQDRADQPGDLETTDRRKDADRVLGIELVEGEREKVRRFQAEVADLERRLADL